jgi:hypothetical protein
MAESPKSAPTGVVLRSDYLSALENLAQSIGTMGPVATIGTVLPLLIYKSGNGTWLLFLGILAAFCLISTSIMCSRPGLHRPAHCRLSPRRDWASGWGA